MAIFTRSVLERIEFDEPKAPDVPLVVDDWSLAFRLGFRGKALWAIAGRKIPLYKVFTTKKKSGGTRVVHDPSDINRLFQKQLRLRILKPLVEKLGEHVAAYQAGKSVKHAALRHLAACPTCAPHDVHTCKQVVVAKAAGTGHGYKVKRSGHTKCLACQPVPKHECPRDGVKIHMDLKDFFDNTRRAWIRKYFHEKVGYNHYVSSLLAQCLTYAFTKKKRDGKTVKWNGVPQGGKTSGEICNLVADWKLDQPLLAALEGSGWTYTRYADDLYFSHPKNLSSEEVNAFIKLVEAKVKAAGWRVNGKKTHVQRYYRRQQHLGMVINRKVGMPRDNFKRWKARIFNCYAHGFEGEVERRRKQLKNPKQRETYNVHAFQSFVEGNLNWFKQIDPHKGERLEQLWALAKTRHANELNPEMAEAA